MTHSKEHRSLPPRFPELLRVPVTDSTNAELRRMIDANTCVDGAVVIADQQTGGRGRLGRTWASPRGNLHLSLARRPDESHEITTAMTLVTGLALAQALEDLTGLRASIKWPNDLQLQGLKLAGILVEGHSGWQIIGLGVNVETSLEELPTELRYTATTLRYHADPLPSPLGLGVRFLESFAALEAAMLARGTLDMDLWRRYWGDRGRRVQASLGRTPLEGVPLEVTPQGVLRIQDDQGLIHDIRSGEILHLRHHDGREDVSCD